jgi:CRP/FNR family transcriptional regulator, cyclic AMP receptor protein
MNALTDIIARNPFFSNMAPEHLDIFAGCATEAQFKADQVVFQEGEPANQFYLIESGRVAIEAHQPADGTALVQILGSGEMVGWSWLFPPFAWHFRVRALEPTKAIVFNGAHLLVAAERNRDFGYELMKRVAQVVIHRLQATRKQLLNQQIESALDG